ALQRPWRDVGVAVPRRASERLQDLLLQSVREVVRALVLVELDRLGSRREPIRRQGAHVIADAHAVHASAVAAAFGTVRAGVAVLLAGTLARGRDELLGGALEPGVEARRLLERGDGR